MSVFKVLDVETRNVWTWSGDGDVLKTLERVPSSRTREWENREQERTLARIL